MGKSFFSKTGKGRKTVITVMAYYIFKNIRKCTQVLQAMKNEDKERHN